MHRSTEQRLETIIQNGKHNDKEPPRLSKARREWRKDSCKSFFSNAPLLGCEWQLSDYGAMTESAGHQPLSPPLKPPGVDCVIQSNVSAAAVDRQSTSEHERYPRRLAARFPRAAMVTARDRCACPCWEGDFGLFSSGHHLA